jgi:hypothetical protein
VGQHSFLLDNLLVSDLDGMIFAFSAFRIFQNPDAIHYCNLPTYVRTRLLFKHCTSWVKKKTNNEWSN